MIDSLSSVIDLVNQAGSLFWRFASHMFVQTLVLVAVLFVADLVLRRRVRAAVRYWLWALVLLKLVLPVTLRTPASVAYWLLREPAPVATAATTSAPEMPAMRFAPSTSSADPFEAPEAWPPELNGTPEAAGSLVAAHQRPVPQSPPRRALPNSEAATVAASARSEFPRLTAAGWLFLGWCGGCVVLAIMVLRRAAKVWQLARRAAQAPRQLEIPLEVACSLLDVSPASVRLRISDEVGCPAICGFWRPTILVPRRLVGQLGADQFQLVFAHELLHWKRWDLQLNLLQTLLQIAYFYNPAVWIANVNLRRLREEAVDDAVLLFCGTPRESYSNTLLDVAAQSLRPVELSLRLIGILESRKALAERIGRMASLPFPKSARLGPWGLAAVGLVGLALVPMAGSPRAVAQRPAEQAGNAAPAKSSIAVHEPEIQPPAPAPPLRGRITDEEGKPVSDATIQIINVSNRLVQETATNRNGGYRFDRVWFPGEHEIVIYSNRCLGFTRSPRGPRIVVDPTQPAVHDFKLKIACQVRVQAINEDGHPVQGARLIKARPFNPYQPPTDGQGWMTIGGLEPGAHVFVFQSDGYMLTRLAIKIESPKTILERKLSLQRGVDVRGRALCSDGKPASGWQVRALPTWWDFNSLPLGEPIKADGTFVLPHIGPGPHDVTVLKPRDGGSLDESTLLKNVDLANHGPLVLHVDAPSRRSMAMIVGRFRFNGGRPKREVWITANSTSPRGLSASSYWPGRGRGDLFSVGPIPRGKYHLVFDSPEIETKEIDAIATGMHPEAEDLSVEIHVHGPIVLRGSVSLPSAKGPEPAREFLVRVVRVKYQTGWQPSERWERVFDVHGQFAEQVPTPGVYAVEATADGFATVRSAPIDTDHMPEKGISLTLSKGATVSGTVVDEEGRPVDGAIVMSLAKAGGQLPVTAADTPDEIGVRTVAGRFEFEGLAPGNDMFQVAHPDFALATLRNVDVGGPGQEPLRIVLKRGGTICGHVQDERGRLTAGAKLEFRRYASHFAGERYRGRFATAVTDANGYYEVHHLPEELIHILRENRGESRGVWHQAVLPVNGKSRTVDFGSGSTISGRLFLNGVPLASKDLMIDSGRNSNNDFDAMTSTDADGTFSFTGVPPGRRYLSYSVGKRRGWNEWSRARALDINAGAHDFGRIDLRLGSVTVKLTGRPKDDAQVYLHDYDPSPFQVHLAGRSRRPRATDSPFVFENIAEGHYDIAVYLDKGSQHVNRKLVISPDNLNPMVTVEWPHGTASIRGTIDGALRDRMGHGFIRLYSADVRWSSTVQCQEDGRFEISEIPAGDYTLILVQLRSGGFIPVTLNKFHLTEKEVKTLDVRREGIPQSEFAKEVLQIGLFTPQGRPLPGCNVRLTGTDGPLKPALSFGAEVQFAAPPGSYQLSVSYPGAAPVTQTVEIKPTFKNGSWTTQDHVLNLTLAPVP
jgi:beta-lactamase regulating signal transducer with metallopeptidase domain/protocatechuate 3,4-dioxygenase beta subunit